MGVLGEAGIPFVFGEGGVPGRTKVVDLVKDGGAGRTGAGRCVPCIAVGGVAGAAGGAAGGVLATRGYGDRGGRRGRG